MKSYFSILFISITVLTSCKDENSKSVETNPRNVVPFYQNVTPVSDPAAVPVPVAKGMNPQHGQPGHRCDIAVGAPLNSPVASTAKSPSQNAPASTYTVNSAAPSAEVIPTAEGMNPPHGQKNNSCDIAVGAPLPVSN